MINSIVPLLLRPRLISLVNSLVGRNGLQGSNHSRATLFLSFLLMLLVFIAANSTLRNLQAVAEFKLAHLNGLVLLCFTAFFSLALLTSLTSAISVLFTSNELDRLFAAPISYSRLFIGKLAELVVSSGVMQLVLGLPLFVAFVINYKLALTDWPVILLAIVLLFTLAFTVAYSITIIALRFIPLAFLRTVIVISMLALIGTVFIGIDHVAESKNVGSRALTLSKLLDVESNPLINRSPPGWAAQVVSAAIGHNQQALSPLSILGILTTLSLAFGYFVTRYYYQTAYTGMLTTHMNLSIDSRKGHQRWNLIFCFLSRQSRALLSKELKIFARDFSQMPQLALLIGLCLIYILNFKNLDLLAIRPDLLQKIAQPIFLSLNIAMGGFITCAIATRFIYPSVSLDGRSFWITAVAPLSLRRFIRYKFWIWYWPTAIITATVLTSGAMALQADPWLIAITALTSFVVTYGIVGLAIGIGTMFVNFHWEHQTQLTASLGSLVFIVCAIALVTASTLAIGLPFLLYQLHSIDNKLSLTAISFIITTCFTLLAYINYLTANYCMKQGVRALQETGL